jgi:hypothetical protein
MIGFGMLGRAELFFVVLNVAYIEFPIFTEEMFFSLTMAAMLLNISVPITISLYKPYYVRKTSETDDEPHLRSSVSLSSKKVKEIVHAKASKAEHARQRRVFNVTMTDEQRIASQRPAELGSEQKVTKTVSSHSIISAELMISRNVSDDSVPTGTSALPVSGGNWHGA